MVHAGSIPGPVRDLFRCGLVEEGFSAETGRTMTDGMAEYGGGLNPGNIGPGL